MTHGCGSEMGVAALEHWVEMDNATRSAPLAAHDMTAAEAMTQCKEKVQEATTGRGRRSRHRRASSGSVNLGELHLRSGVVTQTEERGGILTQRAQGVLKTQRAPIVL
ncbi:MAG: hypothetical protein R2911_19975 [Caldilineaceae bacterium]